MAKTENNYHIKTADEIFKEVTSHNEELIKVSQEKEEKKVETIDVTKIAESLRKSAEITAIEVPDGEEDKEKKSEEKDPEKKPVEEPEKKPEEKKKPEEEPEKKPEEKPEKKPEEKEAQAAEPGPVGGGPEGMPPEPKVTEEKAHEPPKETKTDAKFEGPLDQGKIKESPAPDAGVKGPSPDDKPKEPEQPKHEISDGEKPNNEIKIAMGKLVKTCQELYPVKESAEGLEKDAKAGLWKAILKVAPFLAVGGGGAAGATAVVKEKHKKALPRVYGAGVRRGYFAGARAGAQAYMKRFGGKNG